MYAIIETGGKQYRVSVGDVIEVEKLSAAEGDKAKCPSTKCLWLVGPN